jgi:hypothetical protein
MQIAQVKEKIFKHKNEEKEWEPTLQKLIYSGKRIDQLHLCAHVADLKFRQDPYGRQDRRVLQGRREGIHSVHACQGTHTSFLHATRYFLRANIL